MELEPTFFYEAFVIGFRCTDRHCRLAFAPIPILLNRQSFGLLLGAALIWLCYLIGRICIVVHEKHVVVAARGLLRLALKCNYYIRMLLISRLSRENLVPRERAIQRQIGILYIVVALS